MFLSLNPGCQWLCATQRSTTLGVLNLTFSYPDWPSGRNAIIKLARARSRIPIPNGEKIVPFEGLSCASPSITSASVPVTNSSLGWVMLSRCGEVRAVRQCSTSSKILFASSRDSGCRSRSERFKTSCPGRVRKPWGKCGAEAVVVRRTVSASRTRRSASEWRLQCSKDPRGVSLRGRGSLMVIRSGKNVQRIQVVKGFRGDFTTTDNSQRVSFRVTKEPGSECC